MKTNSRFKLKLLVLGLGLTLLKSTMAQETNPVAPCPKQFTQSCTFVEDLLANKRFNAKNNYHHDGNGETNYYLSSQVQPSADNSVLTLITESVPAGKSYSCSEAGPCKYISGWTDTQGHWSTAGINHGYVEVSASMPVSLSGTPEDNLRYQGLWPAIWMLPNDNGAGWPVNGEIDISELHGADPYHAGTTLHYNDVRGSTAYADGTFADNPAIATSASSYGNYHTYGLEWNFDSSAPYLTTWYDGKLVAKRLLDVKDKTPGKNYNLKDVFLRGQNTGGFYLILNIATGGAFGPTGSKTSDGSGKDVNNPYLKMNINSINSWRFDN